VKKFSISLRTANLLLFLVLILAVALIGFEQYRFLKRQFTIELEKRIEGNTYQLQDYFQNRLDKLHYVFNKTAQLDLQKLKEAQSYFGTIDKPLEPIRKKLNENVVFGSYDIYLVNLDKVIVRSTYPPDVGMDFKQYDYASRIFDMVRDGVIPYHVSQPYFSSVSKDFRKYFLILSKNGKFFVQISHNYYLLENVKRELAALRERYPHIERIDAIFSSNELINPLEQTYPDKKHVYDYLERDKKKFLRRFADDLGIRMKIDDLMKRRNLVAALFGGKRMRYRIDWQGRRAVVYSVSENVFNDSINKEYIILRTVYDLHGDFAGYRERVARLLTVVGLTFVMIVLILLFIRKFFAQQLERMTEALRHDRDIREESFIVKEFRTVANAINAYRQKLRIKNRELETLSHTDALTGVYNRRYFGKMLEKCIYEFHRYGKPFVLVIFDIDDFKAINDEFGHDVGDEVLREMCRIVEHEIRKSDMLFRVGGEEFALLLVPAEGKSGLRIAEAIRKRVAGQKFLSRFAVTISVGVSGFQTDDSAVSLYRRVDEFLYISKQNGKNRVTGDDTIWE